MGGGGQERKEKRREMKEIGEKEDKGIEMGRRERGGRVREDREHKVPRDISSDQKKYTNSRECLLREVEK